MNIYPLITQRDRLKGHPARHPTSNLIELLRARKTRIWSPAHRRNLDRLLARNIRTVEQRLRGDGSKD